jgi:2-succinyl-5-enolpyruvyl-6-hydroxy-3-cyclohexene-1-carboxylate synthase
MTFQPVHDLVELCALKGIEYAVISPGSRSAPLTLAFARHPRIKTFIIPDERSAGFIGLGIAQKTGKTVALVCTSGTAGLNYAPAIAEAFYQQIPLLVLTADRPPEWIDQKDGQAIRQQHLFGNNCKRSFDFPVSFFHKDESWHANHLANEALNCCQKSPKGPVHLNIPFREPLYSESGEPLGIDQQVRTIDQVPFHPILAEKEISALQNLIAQSHKVLIVAGQLPPDERFRNSLNSALSDIPIIADITANLSGVNGSFGLIDQLLLTADDPTSLAPDLLITFGGPVLSKKIKQWIRQNPPVFHWHISNEENVADTFQCLSHHLPVEPDYFFKEIWTQLKGNVRAEQKEYFQLWTKKKEAYLAFKSTTKSTTQLPFNEAEAVAQIHQKLPANSLLQLGNSMAVRYADLAGLNSRSDVEVFANRGTSGIDGSLSTAVGCALATDKTVTLIIGDLSFFYDRNGLWHNTLPPNLRIVLLNNNGGGIFGMIDGPKTQPELKEYFITEQKLNAKSAAAEYGLGYFCAASQRELSEGISWLFQESNQIRLLEVSTTQAANNAAFQHYFKLTPHASEPLDSN